MPQLHEPLRRGVGSGRNKTPLTMLKIAVFAPIPRARTMMAAAAKAGALRTLRSASLKSLSKPDIRKIS
jgi:hypothetical protein